LTRTYADVDLVLLVGVHREVVLRTCGIDLRGSFDCFGIFREVV